MELKIYNPSEDGFLKNIEWNFDELKQEIKQAVEPYKGLVLTDEQIPEGKRTVANLRKFVAAFETERKRIKAQCMEPYEKFKQQYDELLVDVNDAIKGIDIQIKESEKNKKAEKLSRVKEIYQEVVPEGLQNILRFDKLDTNRFCLASTTLKSVKEEIQSLLSRTYSDISVIQKAGGYTFEMMECYKETLDLNTAIRKGQELHAAAERKAAYEAEQQKQKEAEAAYKEQRRKEAELLARANDGFDVAEQSAVVTAAQDLTGKMAEPIYKVGLNIHGTRTELDLFCGFLNEHGIRYDITSKPEEEK